LALGWYSLDEAGKLLTASTTGWQRPDSWGKVVDAAQQYNLNTEMVVHITDGDGKLSRCLSNPEAVKTAVQAIAGEAVLYNGVNLDFEGLGWNEEKTQLAQTQANFTNFATLLSQELKRSSRQLTLTLHAPNSAYLGYDYAALGKVADYIIIMAYDYGSKPEPVAMIRQAVETAEFSVPTSKLLLGISVVGENPESLQTITGVAKKYKLGGIALWRLGLLNSETWRVLGENVIKL
ncbi:MAG: glycosyl hydrolase family 18 protein, partial [Syntrophomonas sp.]